MMVSEMHRVEWSDVEKPMKERLGVSLGCLLTSRGGAWPYPTSTAEHPSAERLSERIHREAHEDLLRLEAVAGPHAHWPVVQLLADADAGLVVFGAPST